MDISQPAYEDFKRKFERENASDLSEKMADLPEELDLFINSLKDMTPKAKAVSIEKFVRDISFYDMDNAEVAPYKRGKTLEEQMIIMEERMDQLKGKMPEYAEKLAGKKYAGVCADFGLVSTALLRRAGVLSGVVYGFLPHSKKVTTADAHGVSFVLFPDELGRNKIFTVDGTPRGIDAEQEKELAEMGVLTPGLEEVEKAATAEISELKEKAEKELAKILETIKGDDAEAIKKLTNGQLENALNTILKYSVKVPHLEALKRVMEAYWYTPTSSLDLSDAKNRVEAGKFFTDELRSVRAELAKKPEVTEKPAGNYLFDSVRDFSDKFVKQEKAKGIKESYDLLEKVFESAQGSLNDTERKAIAAIITYLRAKKMTSSKT
jgi:ribosomal protein L29